MKFNMTANINFEADDLDCAFEKLSNHFKEMMVFGESMEFTGSIHIVPEK